MPDSIAAVLEEARPVLLRLAMVSHAPALRLGAVRGSNGAHESSRPPGELIPDAEYFHNRLQRSETVSDARETLSEARACLAGVLRRAMAHVPGESAVELAARITEDGAGWTAEDVAQAMRVTPTFVRRARLLAGRDPENGLTPPDADPMVLAVELFAAGRSLRTIARLTGIPRSTLHDRLR